ncbi:MAG: hypothetical protein KC585_03700, partial [Candidatus Magasanikbacteria bacterium]|nr:hypothetical protein [Candidatus Magasanikbacteria bacterium]
RAGAVEDVVVVFLARVVVARFLTGVFLAATRLAARLRGARLEEAVALEERSAAIMALVYHLENTAKRITHAWRT